MRIENHVRNRLTNSEAKKFLDLILNDNKKISFDPHTSVYSQFVGSDPAKLQDVKYVTSVILSSIVQARMRLMSFSLTKFEGGGGGITAVAVVSDSHIIVNTFPETTSLILDVYACSGAPINVLYEFKRRFKPEKIDFVVYPRVLNENADPVIEENDIADKKVREWAKKKKLVPLLTTSEESMVLANLIGFFFDGGYLSESGDKIEICHKNKFILKVLKEKLKKIGIKSEVTSSKSCFKLTVNDKNFGKYLSIIGAPKGKKKKLVVPKWIKKSIPILASFTASVLLSNISRIDISDLLEGGFGSIQMEIDKNNSEFSKELKRILSTFRIKSVEERQKDKIVLKIAASKENLMRIQAITSLNKIFPMGMFEPALDTEPIYKLYDLNEPFYKIIDFMIDAKESTISDISKKIKLNGKSLNKWIKVLEKSNIIRLEKNGVVKLNI